MSGGGLTTLVLIVGDRKVLGDEAAAMLDSIRYFVETRGDTDPIHIVVDGPEWHAGIGAEKFAIANATVSVLDHESHLPAALIERGLAETSAEFHSFLWPGVEVSTWFANKSSLLAHAKDRSAGLVCGYRGSGERRRFAHQSYLTHPDDGFSPDAPKAWLQMLDLVPMANCVLRRSLWQELSGFSMASALQRAFWWEFTLRVAGRQSIACLPLQPISSLGWHTYRFGRRLALPTGRVQQRMMWAQGGHDRTTPLLEDEARHSSAIAPAENLWASLPTGLRTRLDEIRAIRPLRIVVLGGVNEPAHNQLCFFNYFERMRDWGLVEWRTCLDTLAQPADLAFCDLVIFSRVRSANGARLMDFCRGNGVATLYMLDDNWFWLGREWQEYAGIFAPGLPDFDNFLHCLKQADVTLTYNQALAEDLAPHARKLMQIPTNVDLSVFPRVPRNDKAPTVIGYVGSLRKNLAPFAALVEIARARNDVQILVMSNALPEEFAGLPAGRVQFHPYQFNYAGYAKTVCEARPDVLVAPIGATRFEASKCPNKFLEITACGAAGVYSRTEPYLSSVRDGETGLFAGEDVAEWRRQIERLIDDAPLRRNIVSQALQVVAGQYDTAAVLPKFLEVLQEATESVTFAENRVCAWLASAPSLAMTRWMAKVERNDVRPVFVEMSAEPVEDAQAIRFAVVPEVDAVTDLLQSLPLAAVIVSGFDVAAPALAAARRAGLSARVVGANDYENTTFEQLLPGQFFDRKLRARGVILPIPAQDQDAKAAAAAREQPRAKLVARLQDRRDAWQAMSRAFPGVSGSPRLSALHDAGFLLQPSGDLRNTDCHSYWLNFETSTALDSISLFAMVECFDSTGSLEIEWGHPASGYASRRVELPGLGPLALVRVAVPQDHIAAGDARELRIRVHSANAPLRIVELRRYRWGGLQVDLQPCWL